MNRKFSFINRVLIGAIIYLSFGCSSDVGSIDPAYQNKQSVLFNKEDILLKVNGICGKNRSYGLLESDLIYRKDGLSEIRQIIFRENGTYIEASETFKITQKGKNLFSFSDRIEIIKNGNWSISSSGVKMDSGLLNYLDDNYSFILSSYQNEEAVTYRRIEKISEQFIPQDMGCLNRSENLAKSSIGKFAVKRNGSNEKSGLIRNTLKEENVTVLFTGVHSLAAGTPVYCNRFGFSSFCEITAQLNLDMKGTLTFRDGNSQKYVLPVKVKWNDNQIELLGDSGKLIRLIPSPEYSGFFIEDTEEFLAE